MIIKMIMLCRELERFRAAGCVGFVDWAKCIISAAEDKGHVRQR